MKNVLSFTLMLGLLLTLSGCSQKQPFPTYVKTKYLDDNQTVMKTSVTTRINLKASLSKYGSGINSKEALFTVANEAKKHGYPYFALINTNINNLEGFPITNYQALWRYCYPNVKDFELKCQQFIHIESAEMEAVFFKEKTLFVPLWSVEEVLQHEATYREELRERLKQAEYEKPWVNVEYVRGSL